MIFLRNLQITKFVGKQDCSSIHSSLEIFDKFKKNWGGGTEHLIFSDQPSHSYPHYLLLGIGSVKEAPSFKFKFPQQSLVTNIQ